MVATTTLRLPTAETYDWQLHAACRGGDSEVFFGSDGERGHARLYREHRAKQVCAACPVRRECLIHALSTSEAYGVWGGLTPTERGQRPTHAKTASSAT